MVRAALRGALGRAEGRRCVNSTRPNRGDPDRPVDRAPGRSNGALGVESKRVDEFENMSDEELRQYIYGNKELDS
jgi:hypothetical protein